MDYPQYQYDGKWIRGSDDSEPSHLFGYEPWASDDQFVAICGKIVAFDEDAGPKWDQWPWVHCDNCRPEQEE